MDKKLTFIIIGLAAILVVSLFLNFQTYTAKQAVEQERDVLKRENVLLGKKVEEGIRELKGLETKIGTLNSELTRITTEKDEIQKKFDAVSQEKEELAKKLEGRMPVASSAPAASQELPATEDAYWGAILKAKTDLEIQLQAVRNELNLAQISNEQLQREKANLELEVASLKREQQDLQRQFEYNQKIVNSLSQEVVRERNDKFQIENSLKALKSENGLLRRQLKSLDSRKINLERRFADLQKDKAQLLSRLSELDTAVEEKTVQIESLNKQMSAGKKGAEEGKPVELSPIVVRPQVETSLEDIDARKVMAVNRDKKFVIINAGEGDGIKSGDTFRIWRDNRPIATIEAIQVRSNISACDIKKEITPIKTGDIIR